MISENAGQSLHDKATRGEIKFGMPGQSNGENMTDKHTDNILLELKNKISQKYQLTEMRLFGS
jgi:hypothetical protein